MKNFRFVLAIFSAVFLAGCAETNHLVPSNGKGISDGVVKIGFITDLSSMNADYDGNGGVEAIRMAIADMGGHINGHRIEFVYADHFNRADVAASKAREWFDREGVDVLLGGTNSATNLAMATVAAEKRKPFLSIGALAPILTNEQCTPYTVHYAYDTIALARTLGAGVTNQGGSNWYLLTADYTFGYALEKDISAAVKSNAGQILGQSRHPLNASDFSSYFQQAQASGAQILGLANAGGDTINAIKAANEFGISPSMHLAGGLVFITDINALGLPRTQGMYVAESWYWDLNAETREWSKRFTAVTNKIPTMLHAADYSATMTYLNAVKTAGTDDGDMVMTQLKSTRINDMFAKNGVIRPDGRMVHDMYLMQVKSAAESKYPWDYYKVVQTIPGDRAFLTRSESRCSLWR